MFDRAADAAPGRHDARTERETGRRRAALGSVPDLIAAIEAYLTANNDNPTPFLWTATAESILEKVKRGRVTLDAITN